MFGSEPTRITCHMTLRYDGFEAGRRYRVEARNAANQPRAWLLDDQGQVLARHEIFPRCGPF
ncbi:hypothetical protein D9M69_683110 [compost metagenome]